MSATKNMVKEIVRRGLAASVHAGIGAWMTGMEDPVLGAPLYEYVGRNVELRLYDKGMRTIAEGVSTDWQYGDLLEVKPLSLRELARAHAPTQMVIIGLRTQEGNSAITVPLMVYSELCPVLLEILRSIPRASN